MSLDGLPMSSKQIQSIVESDARVNIWHGAIRSGKTIGSLIRFLMFVAVAPMGGALVVIGRTRDSVARNVFAPLSDASLFGPLAGMVHYTNGAPSATILGRTVFVLGASDAKAEKVIRGLTVAGAYVDEITVIPEEFFTQLLGRMSVPGAQLFGTTNPDNPAHWLKRRFLDRATEIGWRVFHFALADNPSLTAKFIAEISAEFTGLWYRRFVLGEWVAAEGAVYPFWEPAKHTIPWSDLPEMRRLIAVGADYGTTNPSAALMLGLGLDRRLYLVDEWRYDPLLSQVRLTDAELSTSFTDWMAQDHLPYDFSGRPAWVCVDPAAASFKVQLNRDGVHGVTDAENDVAYGIKTFASLLGSGHLKVADRCLSLIEEIPGYSWDAKASDQGIDKPIKMADHSCDAARYAVVTSESEWRNELREAA